MKETIAKINTTKSWFFENINKIGQPLARLIKKKKREESIKLEMKMEKSQQITQKYKGSEETTISNQMPIKWTTWKNGWILRNYNLPKLKQQEIENLNRPITSMELKL